MTSIITVLVYIFKGPAKGRLRVRELLAILKTHCLTSAVVCPMVGLLSLGHIPNFLSQFYCYKQRFLQIMISRFAYFSNTTLQKYYGMISFIDRYL